MSSQKDFREEVSAAVSGLVCQPDNHGYGPNVQRCSLNGHTLTWEEHNPGDHTLVFIHGWSVGRPTWRPILKRFFHLGRCVTVDLPGHYPAETPPDYCHLSQEQLIELETGAIEHISQGHGPVTLIGHSAGGLVALGVAERRPDLVKQIVAINSVVWGEFIGIVRQAQWLLNTGQTRTLEALWNFVLDDPWRLMIGLSFFTYQQHTFLSNRLAWEVCFETFSWYHLHALQNLMILLDLLGVCDIRSLVPSVRVPVLVVAGENDPVLKPEQSYWLHEHLPNSELRVFERTGHIPQMEAPVAFHRVVSEWMQAPS